MYYTKKLHLGRHKLDNGKEWVGSGWATVNHKSEIVTSPNLVFNTYNVEVFTTKKSAEMNTAFKSKKERNV